MADEYFRTKAKAWTLGETGNGTAQIGVSFMVPDGNGGEKQLTWYGFFSEATIDRTIESLRAMGFQGDDLETLAEGGTGRLDSNDVEIVVGEEEYQGQTYERVKWVNKPKVGVAMKKVLDGNERKQLASALKDRFRAFDAAAGQRAPSSKPGAPKPAQSTQRPASSGDPRPEPPPADLPF